MGKYADLEKEHGLEDIMPVKEYRYKAHQMEGALRQLVEHRRQIQGCDLAPNYDAVRFWPVVVSAYPLLEQCLKLLVGIRTEGYLNGEAQTVDRHDLAKVFHKLTELDRGLLEECYAEYASFVQFPPKFQSLEKYLQVLSNNRGQIAWRYFLLEVSRESMGALPSPMSPDMLLEIMHGALDILMAKGWTDHGMHGVHRRLEHQLSEALSRPLLREGLSIDDLDAWVRRDGGLINAFSKYIRAGPLDGEAGDVLTKWLNGAVEQLRQSAEQQHDVDMLRFLYTATRCCMTTDGKRFEFRNHRPKPISESLGQWRGGWSLSWQAGSSSWSGPIDDPPSRRLNDWGLPLRTGQAFRASWHQTGNAPAMRELIPGTCGELQVLRHDRVLAQMRARVTSRGLFGPFVNSDEPLASTDRGEKLAHTTFIRTGDCSDADRAGSEHKSDSPKLASGYVCPDCAGTGFCRYCLGEAAKADDCGVCADALGLCPTCRGYGLDGHHAIMDAMIS